MANTEKVLSFKILVKGEEATNATLNKFQFELDETVAKIKSLQVVQRSSTGLNAEQKIKLADLTATKKQYQAAITEVNKATNKEAQLFTVAKGSMAELRAQTALMVQKADQMAVATKKDEQARKQLITQIDANKQKIRDFDRSISGSSTLVGEYEKGFSGAFKKIGMAIAGVMAAFVAVRGITNFLGASLEEYGKQATAEAQLLFALKGRKDEQQALIKQAGELQKVSLFSDEDILQSQQYLASLGLTKIQIENITKAAVDYAAVSGKDLNGAMIELTKTMSGTLGKGLGKLMPELQRFSKEELAAGAAIDAVSKKFIGQAQVVAESGTSPIKMLGNAWGEVKEKIGGFVAGAIMPMVSGLKDWLFRITEVNEASKRHIRTQTESIIQSKNEASYLQSLLITYNSLTQNGLVPNENQSQELINTIALLKGELGDNIFVIDKETGQWMLNTQAVQDNVKAKQDAAAGGEAELIKTATETKIKLDEQNTTLDISIAKLKILKNQINANSEASRQFEFLKEEPALAVKRLNSDLQSLQLAKDATEEQKNQYNAQRDNIFLLKQYFEVQGEVSGQEGGVKKLTKAYENLTTGLTDQLNLTGEEVKSKIELTKAEIKAGETKAELNKLSIEQLKSLTDAEILAKNTTKDVVNEIIISKQAETAAIDAVKNMSLEALEAAVAEGGEELRILGVNKGVIDEIIKKKKEEQAQSEKRNAENEKQLQTRLKYEKEIQDARIANIANGTAREIAAENQRRADKETEINREVKDQTLKNQLLEANQLQHIANLNKITEGLEPEIQQIIIKENKSYEESIKNEKLTVEQKKTIWENHYNSITDIIQTAEYIAVLKKLGDTELKNLQAETTKAIKEENHKWELMKQTLTEGSDEYKAEFAEHEKQLIDINKIASQVKEFAAKQDTERIKKAFDRETLLRETAFNLEYAALGDDEKAKKALKEKYNSEELARQKKFYEDQIKLAQDKLNLDTKEEVEGVEMVGGQAVIKYKTVPLTDEEKESLQAQIDKAGNELSGIKVKITEVEPEKKIFGFTEGEFDKKINEVASYIGGVQELWASFDQMRANKEQASFQKFEANQNKEKAALKKKLDSGAISQIEYDKKIAKIEEEGEKRKRQIAYDEAKRTKRNAIFEIIIGTAVSVAKSLWNPFQAILAGALGLAKLAIVMAQPLPELAKGAKITEPTKAIVGEKGVEIGVREKDLDKIIKKKDEKIELNRQYIEIYDKPQVKEIEASKENSFLVIPMAKIQEKLNKEIETNEIEKTFNTNIFKNDKSVINTDSINNLNEYINTRKIFNTKTEDIISKKSFEDNQNIINNKRILNSKIFENNEDILTYITKINKVAKGSVIKGQGNWDADNILTWTSPDEAVINARSLKEKDTYTMTGTPLQIASQINTLKGYGVAFASYGKPPSKTITNNNSVDINTIRNIVNETVSGIKNIPVTVLENDITQTQRLVEVATHAGDI
jgi:hypothetical protein